MLYVDFLYNISKNCLFFLRIFTKKHFNYGQKSKNIGEKKTF